MTRIILDCPLCGTELHRAILKWGGASEEELVEVDIACIAHFTTRHRIRVWLSRRTHGFLGIQGFPYEMLKEN